MIKKKIAVVFGTRPEAIKMAPVIKELNVHHNLFETTVIVTAQHREMLDQVLNVFQIKPDYDLNIMKKNQSLSDITSDVLKGIERVFIQEKPDMVLVHGDTTTSFASAMAAYYQHIPIGHVEAGLRTNDKYFPFPEEINRQLIDKLADLYFVPTDMSKCNLLKEGVSENLITITGNTVIDAIHYTKASINDQQERKHEVLNLMDSSSEQNWILLTMHRRENHGQPMKNVFGVIREVVDKHPNISVLMPVHLSPAVQQVANEILGQHDRIHLVDPLEVDVFHYVLNRAYIVLTDSGGLQEEAPALDVPVLVLRDKTERPEGLEAGTLKVVGTEKGTVKNALTELLQNPDIYQKMSSSVNPYGDGLASGRIIKEIVKYFNLSL